MRRFGEVLHDEVCTARWTLKSLLCLLALSLARCMLDNQDESCGEIYATCGTG
jgi:hypothetical protein